MTLRWPVRVGGLAIGLTLAACGAAQGSDVPRLLVRAVDGEVVARVQLDDQEFALRYRNSVYGSLVEERFTAAGEVIALRELAADELAVLEEYYAIDVPATAAPPDDERAWVAPPAIAVREERLRLAATALGERTLLVPGHAPLELWRLAPDGEPMLTLEVER